MSLINQMLQDLDARQAVHGARHALPNDVRPLPGRRSSRLPLFLGGLVLLVLAGGFAFYQWQSRPPPVQAIVAAAATAAPVPEVAPEVLSPPAPSEALEPAEAPPAQPPTVPMTPIQLPSAPEQEARLNLRMAPSITPATAVAAKPATAVAGEKKPAPARPKLEASEAAPPQSVEQTPSPTPPAAGRSSKGSTVEKTDALGSPREHAETEYRKAIAAVNQGRVADAIENLRLVLRDDALHGAARQLLLKLLLEARRSDEAIVALKDGLQGQPAQLGWAMTLARLQVDRGDLPGAWQTLDYSLPAAGNNADYQGFAAHVLQRLGRYREAVKHYQAATGLASGDGRWWLGLGLAQEAEGNNVEAREAFLRARQSGTLSAELMALVEQKLR